MFSQQLQTLIQIILTNFDSAFRHSAFTSLIDNTDDAITSNITTVKLSKDFTPTIKLEQNILFHLVMHYIIHTLDMMLMRVVYFHLVDLKFLVIQMRCF